MKSLVRRNLFARFKIVHERRDSSLGGCWRCIRQRRIKRRVMVLMADRTVHPEEHILILRFDDPEVSSLIPNIDESNVEKIKIDIEDIQCEIAFWNSALICYVIGANPLGHVMEGFVCRIWRNQGVDKVVMLKKGMFIVRFRPIEKRDAILAGKWIVLG